MRYWAGISKRIGKRTWLNWTGKGFSVTESLGHGARINYNPKYGTTFRYSKRLGKGHAAGGAGALRSRYWRAVRVPRPTTIAIRCATGSSS